jgi:ABC-type transport system involved in cytochrome c biogenesis permease subunit
MLRIHTVLIIASYAVITLAYVVANAYLIVTAWRSNSALARATLGAQLGAILCLTLAYRGWFEEATAERFVMSMSAALGGGALLSLGLFPIITGSGRRASLARITGSTPEPRTGLLSELDFAHRVLLYIASVALFVGVVLGAIWADYSWGRPWGWDPKEVFALNTWLVYAILIHVPFVSKRRALWTSVLSVCGFAAMQFNWWVVNFYIVGLHSYA